MIAFSQSAHWGLLILMMAGAAVAGWCSRTIWTEYQLRRDAKAWLQKIDNEREQMRRRVAEFRESE